MKLCKVGRVEYFIMGMTLIEKIIANHCDQKVAPGATVDMRVDVRAARDFGGANVVKNLRAAGLKIADPSKTLFTFDCNPGGSDQGYAANQQLCREFARETGVGLRDVTQGIGTHIAFEDGLVGRARLLSVRIVTPTSWVRLALLVRAWVTKILPMRGVPAKFGLKCQSRQRLF